MTPSTETFVTVVSFMVAVPFRTLPNTAGVDDLVLLNVHRVHSQALFRVRAEVEPRAFTQMHEPGALRFLRCSLLPSRGENAEWLWSPGSSTSSPRSHHVTSPTARTPATPFGLTLCDSQSSPEFTTKCRPDSDTNNLVNPDPTAPDYIGKHPGNAFMELQFYGPGYVPQFEGFGCTAHQYCAAMTIDSRTQNQNTGVENTSACNNFILGGFEPINWAYVTK